MAKDIDQPGQRRPGVLRDVHGRQWRAEIDKRTGHPAGPMEPLFTAPWYPEQKYLSIDPRDDRLVLIDYDRNIADLRDAHFKYDQYRIDEATKMYGSAWAKMVGNTPSDDPEPLKRIVRNPPKPVEFPEAAKEGNKWVLGFTEVVPPWAKSFVESETRVVRKYLDADEAADLDERYDPEALGGKVRKPASPKQKLYRELVAEHGPKEAARLWREMKAQKELVSA